MTLDVVTIADSTFPMSLFHFEEDQEEKSETFAARRPRPICCDYAVFSVFPTGPLGNDIDE